MSRAAAEGAPPAPAASPRLLSLDALRGFDMFWILGGDFVKKYRENRIGAAIDGIHFDGMQYRRDIGHRALR